MSDPIDRLLDGIEHARVPEAGAFAADAVLDATVPNWRFEVLGADHIHAELGGWFAAPGHFDEVRRTPLPHGELVQFVLSWEEDGEPHLCHQAHVLDVHDGLITRDTVWCGGRWGAALQAEMADAVVAGV